MQRDEETYQYVRPSTCTRSDHILRRAQKVALTITGALSKIDNAAFSGLFGKPSSKYVTSATMAEMNSNVNKPENVILSAGWLFGWAVVCPSLSTMGSPCESGVCEEGRRGACSSETCPVTDMVVVNPSRAASKLSLTKVTILVTHHTRPVGPFSCCRGAAWVEYNGPWLQST
jgi:hypothetical protein